MVLTWNCVFSCFALLSARFYSRYTQKKRNLMISLERMCEGSTKMLSCPLGMRSLTFASLSRPARVWFPRITIGHSHAEGLERHTLNDDNPSNREIGIERVTHKRQRGEANWRRTTWLARSEIRRPAKLAIPVMAEKWLKNDPLWFFNFSFHARFFGRDLARGECTKTH